MHASNKTTNHNRTIELSDIPMPRDGNGKYAVLSRMHITISYVHNEVVDFQTGTSDDVGRVTKGLTLANCVIPEIIRAVNQSQAVNHLVEVAHEAIRMLGLDRPIDPTKFLLEALAPFETDSARKTGNTEA